MSSEAPKVMMEDSACHEQDEECSTHPMTEALVSWFTENGGQISSDVQVVCSHSRGFHMRAVRPLKSPVVVTCPLKLTLSCLNLNPHQNDVLFIDSCLRPCQGQIPDHILTYLLLIEQLKKGKESPWYAYIACLPRAESLTTPLWFDDEDMALLAGTSLVPAVKERKGSYQQQWEHALSVLRSAGVALADEIDLESLLWAATIFTSRAFISTHILPGHETVPILFPVVDILNHSVSAKVEWDFQPHASFSLKLLEGDTFTPGQELFNNYAPKQNDELLLGYGFCLEDNPIEQFPLKLAFPPMLQEHAQATGLFEPGNVPFNMRMDFLSKNSNTEQHFLRAQGHPFGRYDNCIPFFRGIPPYIVHFFFIQTLLSLELEVGDINVQKPGSRITLQILTLLHQAIDQRSQALPLSIQQQPQNDKQKYAKIYRDGQAKIIHSIRLELQSALDRIRTPKDSTIPSNRPVLLTSPEALAALPSNEVQRFNSGVTKHALQPNDPLVWTLVLACFATYSLTRKTDNDSSLTTSWLRTLYARYSLPSLEDGIEDADTYTFVDEHLADFVESEEDDDIIGVLDDIGDNHVGVGQGTGPMLLHGKTENLGARTIMWAMRVVEQEVVVVQGVGRCMLFEPVGEDVDGWMYSE